MRQKHLAFLAACLTLFSCSDKHTGHLLAGIDSCMQEHPDSALAALESIEQEKLNTRALRAHYSLLLAMALDKNYIDTADTRVIQPAVDYYERHGTPDEKMRTLYSLGKVYTNAQEYNKAIIAFLRAAQFTRRSRDARQCGFVHAETANTYSRTSDFSKATDHIDKAIAFFSEYGDRELVYMEELRKAQNLVNIRKWEEADSLFSRLVRDTTMAADLLGLASGSYGQMLSTCPESDPEKAVVMFSQAERLNGALEDLNQKCTYAFILFTNGRTDEARERMANLQEEGFEDTYEYQYWQSRISALTRNYESAYRSLRSALLTSNEMLSAVNKKSAVKAHEEYLEQATLQLQTETKLKYAMLLSALFFILAMALSVTMVMRKINRRLATEKIALSHSLEKNIRQLEDTQNLLKDYFKAKKSGFHGLGVLYELVVKADGPSGKGAPQQYVYDKVKELVSIIGSDQEGQKEFEKMLDAQLENVMKEFRQDFPDLVERDYRIASCFFAGFDAPLVMNIFGFKTNMAVHSKKRRLKIKIASSSSCHKEKFLKLLK